MDQARVTKTRNWLAPIARLFSDQGLTKKAYLNTLAAGLDYSARFIIRFLVTPIILAGLGETIYGVWEVIRKSTDYLSASGRSTQALKWYVVDRQSSDNEKEKQAGVGGALLVSALFLPLQLAIGAVVVYYAPVWFNAPAEAFWAARACTAIIIGGVIARGFTDVSRSVLEGENLGYKRIWISAVLVVLGGVLTVLAIKMGTGLVGIAFAHVATTLLTGLAFLMVVKSYVPWFGVAKPDRTTIREFMGLSGWFIGWFIVNSFMAASDVVVLGIFATPKLVTFYSLMRFLPEATLRFVTVLVFETVPGLGKILGSGDVERAAKARGEIMMMTWLATTVVGATILLWNDNFVRLWIGPGFAGGQLTTFLVMALMVQFVWFRIDADFINLDLDQMGRKVLLGAFSVGVSLVLGIGLLQKYDAGINGVCIGFIIGRIILSIGYPAMVGKILNVSLVAQLKAAIRPAIVTTLIFVAISFASQHIDIPQFADWLTQRIGLGNGAPKSIQWLILVIGGVTSSLVIAAFAFFAGMSTIHRRQLFSRIQKMVSRS